MNVYYSPDYVGAAYAFETTRKAEWVADSLAEQPVALLRLVAPPPLTFADVAAVHDPAYVRAVESGSPRYLAESQGFSWDPGMWPMVLSSNGGVVAAALDALATGLSGSLSSGLHHAHRATGAGFCTFNGLAIAARRALAAGAGSVLILDLDAHCGGGTAELVIDEPRIWQVDVAVDGFDYYSDGFRARSEGRLWFELVQRSEDYLPQIERGLEEVARRGPDFDLCLYNAGMDPFERCPTGGLSGITQEILAARERLVFDRLAAQGTAVAFVLAGGYVGFRLDRAELVALHRLTLTAAAKSGAALGDPPAATASATARSAAGPSDDRTDRAESGDRP